MIDTTCVDPSGHLVYWTYYDGTETLVPAFSPGTILITSCSCRHQADLDTSGSVDSVDLAAEIDVVFFGSVEPQDPDCPITRCDFDGNGFSDSVDLSQLIDYVFFGGNGPTDPCGP